MRPWGQEGANTPGTVQHLIGRVVFLCILLAASSVVLATLFWLLTPWFPGAWTVGWMLVEKAWLIPIIAVVALARKLGRRV